LSSDVRQNVEAKKRLRKQITELDQKLKKLQDLLLNGVWEAEDYKEMKSTLKLQKLIAEGELEKVGSTTGQDFLKELENGFVLVENLGKYYAAGDSEVKRKIVGSMFPKNFIFENSEVRTNEVDITFLLFCKNSKGLRRIKKRTFLKNQKRPRK